MEKLSKEIDDIIHDNIGGTERHRSGRERSVVEILKAIRKRLPYKKSISRCYAWNIQPNEAHNRLLAEIRKELT